MKSVRTRFSLLAQNKVPKGVQVGFKPSAFEPIVWDKLPEDEDWFRHG